MLTGSEDCLPGTELTKSSDFILFYFFFSPSDFTSGRCLQGRDGESVDSGVAGLCYSAARTEVGLVFFPLDPTSLLY